MRYYIFPIFASLLLGACSDKTPKQEDPAPTTSEPVISISEPELDALREVSVQATSQFFPSENIVKVSLAPEIGLGAWTSPILLLSESGKLYSTNTASEQVVDINDGPFSDILGLSRGFDPAMILAANEAGNIVTLMEDDDKTFQPIAVDSADITAFSFCATSPATPDTFIVVDKDGSRMLNYSVSNNAIKIEDRNVTDRECPANFVLTKQKPKTDAKPFDPKSVFEDEYTGENYDSYELSLSPRGILLSDGEETVSIKIEAGLSIRGISNPAWVFSSNAPLGNTFNGGVTLIKSKDDKRIVIIANDYLIDQAFGSED